MSLPDFSFENKLQKRGFRIIAGIDEVGRGSFAGPVVAAAVVIPTDPKFYVPDSVCINDSKQLTAKQRELACVWIKENAVAWGVGEASVGQINKLGIKKASEIAFRKAIANSEIRIDFLLIDAFYIPYVKGLRRKNQLAIIKGDTKSISIAASSIVAKVYRDKLMAKLAQSPKYKKYKWDRNKGYGTAEHRNAIKKYGTTSKHRKQFVETFLSKV